MRRQSQLMLASPTSRIEDGKVKNKKRFTQLQNNSNSMNFHSTNIVFEFLLQMSYYYLKYLRAQSFRKNLMYQKNYLLIILGGYQDTESVTLEMLGRLGCLSSAYGTHHDLKYSKPFRRFRSLVRVAMAIFRMKFLVRKWNSHFPTASLPPFFQYEVEGKSHGIKSGILLVCKIINRLHFFSKYFFQEDLMFYLKIPFLWLILQ